MTKYIFSVFFFVSCALPAGAQSDLYDELPSSFAPVVNSLPEDFEWRSEFEDASKVQKEDTASSDLEEIRRMDKSIQKNVGEAIAKFQDVDRRLTLDMKNPCNIYDKYMNRLDTEIATLKAEHASQAEISKYEARKKELEEQCD